MGPVNRFRRDAAPSGSVLLFHSCRREQFLATAGWLREHRRGCAVTPLLLPGMAADPPAGDGFRRPIFLADGSRVYSLAGLDPAVKEKVRSGAFAEVVVPVNNPGELGYQAAIRLAYGLGIARIGLIDPGLRHRCLPPRRAVHLLYSGCSLLAFVGLALLVLLVSPVVPLVSILGLRGRFRRRRETPPPAPLPPLPERCSVAAIVPTTGNLPNLRRLLASLRAQTRPPNEVLVVLGGGDAVALEAALEGSYPAGRLRIVPSPLGLTAQKNLGAARSRGDVVIFFDDDIVPEPEFVDELVNPLVRDGSGELAGAAGFITNRSASRPWPISPIEKLFMLPSYGDGRFKRSGFPTWPEECAAARPVEFLPGGLTAWRREVLERFRFDERLKGYAYLEDADFSYRTSRVHRHLSVPTARCIHLSSARGRGQRRLLARMLVDHHLYLTAGNLRGGAITKAAVGLSVWGLLVRSLVCLDSDYALGVLAGMAGARRREAR